MRVMSYALIVILLIILQSTVMAFFQIGGIRPDLPLVFILCVALVKGEYPGAFFGLVSGLLEDIIYGRFLGFNALVKFLTGYIAGYGSRDIYKGPAIITMGLTFLGSFIYNLIFMLISTFLGQINQPWNFFMPVVFPTALFNMLISPFIYHLVVKLERFFDYYFNIKY
ncbi:rod shape-determining protein MreD [Thermoanaerobacterium sp. DL9XJH110]|uniref:rod shape-determining protein MreD n=1 Tax=Thermoanaerobacterium sp. DL9XJH110 TaxID=3386643 RepID=UPI003BB6B160